MFLCRDWMRPSVTKAVSGGDPCSQIAPLFYHGFLRSVAKSLVHSAAAWPADIKRSFASPSLLPTLPPFIFISSLSLPLWPALWYWHHSGSHKRHVFRGTPGLEVDPLPAIVALSSSPQVVHSAAFLQLHCVCARSVSVLSTVHNPMDCSPPVSSVHGIFQARILEWVAISYFRGSSRSKGWTHFSCISCLGRRIPAAVKSFKGLTGSSEPFPWCTGSKSYTEH